jgi:hypothetical protein
MTGFRFFDRIHRKGADRIGHRLGGDAHVFFFQNREAKSLGRGGSARGQQAWF